MITPVKLPEPPQTPPACRACHLRCAATHVASTPSAAASLACHAATRAANSALAWEGKGQEAAWWEGGGGAGVGRAARAAWPGAAPPRHPRTWARRPPARFCRARPSDSKASVKAGGTTAWDTPLSRGEGGGRGGKGGVRGRAARHATVALAPPAPRATHLERSELQAHAPPHGINAGQRPLHPQLAPRRVDRGGHRAGVGGQVQRHQGPQGQAGRGVDGARAGANGLEVG